MIWLVCLGGSLVLVGLGFAIGFAVGTKDKKKIAQKAAVEALTIASRKLGSDEFAAEVLEELVTG